VFSAQFKKGDRLMLTFAEKMQVLPMVNTEYAKPGYFTLNYGPLVLGYETTKAAEISFKTAPELLKLSDTDWIVDGQDTHFSPVYHLMDPKVNKESGYKKQVLFKIGN